MEEYIQEKKVRNRHGYGFFRMVELEEDLGERVHISDISEALGGVIQCPYCGYEWVTRVEQPKACPQCKHRI